MLTKKVKCKLCKKKINPLLSDMNKCKCLKFYCSEHLLNHNCSFNHLEEHKNKLSNTLPKLEDKRIENI
jgi:hypothetical protein